MANETTSTTISELYTEIVAEALFVASEQSIMRNLVRNYTIIGGGKSVEVPIYATVSAAAVAEATDLSNTAVNPSSVTITASEVGIMTTLTDLARNSASRNVAGDIGRLFGEAIARKMDADLSGLFTGFSTEKGPGAGAELTIAVDGSDDSIGGVFSQDALGVAMMQDLKIESQRDASLRADEIVATAVYGVGELHDSYGVKLTADSLAN
jgi:HK97 family phage major capsid protein